MTSGKIFSLVMCTATCNGVIQDVLRNRTRGLTGLGVFRSSRGNTMCALLPPLPEQGTSKSCIVHPYDNIRCNQICDQRSVKMVSWELHSDSIIPEIV